MALANATPDEGGVVQDGVSWAPLSRAGSRALYRQIADRLRAAIDSGVTRLPTERQLASGYSVARVTVRLALDLLAADRLISRQRRFGTVAMSGSGVSSGKSPRLVSIPIDSAQNALVSITTSSDQSPSHRS